MPRNLRRLAPTLDALLALLRSPTATDSDAPVLTDREMTSLPTYGGRAVVHTSGIWSWDARRRIEGTCAYDFRIVERPTCRAYGCDRVTDTAGCADGLCSSHYQQQRRRRPLTPLRPPTSDVDARARITVRVDPPTLARLRDAGAPATVAADVLRRWRP